MTDCLFCKIATGEIPSYTVYETEHVRAFLDIYPIHPGHVLVVPKNHSTDLLDTDAEILGHMIAAAKHVAPAVISATKADGLNIGMNNKEAAGQEIFHIHLHVIPRYKDDGLKTWGKNLFKDDEHKEAIANAIKHELG